MSISKTKTIVIAGKGGTGKTTISALLIRLLSKNGTVLAVDADPSSNLHIALGLPTGQTVGDIREELTQAIKKRTLEPGLAKQNYLELKLQESLVESSGIDLLSIGRPEGPGCYCALNNMLRASIDKLSQNYNFVVIDSEAGMEHISRQTTREVDLLIIVSDMTVKGILSAALMKSLIKELRTKVERIALILNRVDREISPEIKQKIEEANLDLVGLLPYDPEVADFDSHGESMNLSQNSKIRVSFIDIAQKLGLVNC